MTSRLHFMTLRGLLYNTGWLVEAPLLGENYSMRHVDSTRTTQRGWLNEGMTRRGRLGEDHSTRQEDSTRLLLVITRIPKVVRVVCEGHLFCELCWRVYLFIFFAIIWNVQSIINDIYGKSIVLIIIDTFYFISFSIIILSALLPASFETWMILVLMVFSILFQDHEFNATNCRHKHSCTFSPCVQIYFSTF